MNAPLSAGSTFIEDAGKEICGGNRTDEVLLFINIALILNQVHRGTQGAQLHAIKNLSTSGGIDSATASFSGKVLAIDLSYRPESMPTNHHTQERHRQCYAD